MIPPCSVQARIASFESSSAVAGQEIIGGRYRLISLLGHGGQSTVHVAADGHTGQQVALKVVTLCDRGNSEQHQRLMQEAAIGSRIVCEHLVRVLDAGWDERTRRSYLAMELLDGIDLQRLVTQSGPRSPVVALEYLRQAALGLDCAHGRINGHHSVTPIVHRDLKPANLYLTTRPDGSPLIKILDFGIAKVLKRNAVISTSLSGTPLYMAPEQFLGAPVSTATDIWAFGLTAYFLITGRSYWCCSRNPGSNLNGLFAEASAGATEPPSRRWREGGLNIPLGGKFDAWFLRCVHRNPSRRFGSASDAIAALSDALEDNSHSAQLWMSRDRQFGSRPLLLRRRCMTSFERCLWQSAGAMCGFVAVLGGSFAVARMSTAAAAASREIDHAVVDPLPEPCSGSSQDVENPHSPSHSGYVLARTENQLPRGSKLGAPDHEQSSQSSPLVDSWHQLEPAAWHGAR